jgi:hypothetical protein
MGPLQPESSLGQIRMEWSGNRRSEELRDEVPGWRLKDSSNWAAEKQKRSKTNVFRSICEGSAANHYRRRTGSLRPAHAERLVEVSAEENAALLHKTGNASHHPEERGASGLKSRFAPSSLRAMPLLRF